MTGLPSRTTSVSTATRLMVMVENEMKALRISEAIGAVASRMRVIFMRVRPHSAAMRMPSGIAAEPLADQVDMSAQVVELVGVVGRHAHDPDVRIDAVEFGLHGLGIVSGPAGVEPPLQRLELPVPVDQPPPDNPHVDRRDGARHRQQDGQHADHAAAASAAWSLTKAV